MGLYKSYFNKGVAYAKRHPIYHATIHTIGGIAIGILITYPFVGPHPLRWALILGAIAILGHLYMTVAKP